MIKRGRRCPAHLVGQCVVVSVLAGRRGAAVLRPQVPVDAFVLKYQKPL
jgi:hypothetical protein